VPKVKADLAYFDKALMAANEVSDTILTPVQKGIVDKGAQNFANFAT
jgi:hypothetical protein